MAAEQSMGQWPWHEGYYRATGCLYDYVLVRGNSGKTTGLEITFQHGHFGKADQEVFELTKQKEYNVELRFMLGEAIGRIQVPVVEHGIISETCEPLAADELNSIDMKIHSDMSPDDVVDTILDAVK